MKEDSDAMMIFTREVAHDINNLLTTMRGHAELAMAELPQDAGRNISPPSSRPRQERRRSADR